MGEDNTYKRKEQILNITDSIVTNSFKCLNQEDVYLLVNIIQVLKS